MFEKKRGKRFLASVMALVMLLSLAPAGALAADEPPTEESPAAAQSAVEGKGQQAEGKDQQAAVDEAKNTPPPPPAGDPKPVVDTPENGETTNFDTENGVANLPLLDENRPVVDMDMPQEVKPLDDLFNDVLGVEPEQESFNTFAAPTKPTKPQKITASFFYLKTPTSNPDSNTVDDWGSTLGNGEVETSKLNWKISSSYGQNRYVENATNVTSDMLTWPSGVGTVEDGGFSLTKDTTETESRWNDIFEAYKGDVEKQLGTTNITVNDIEKIILKPYKVSRFNKPDGGYHVDCKIEVVCTKYATATFYLWNDESKEYEQAYKYSKTYAVGSKVNFPRMPDEPGYTFSGWYLNEDLTGPVLNEHTIENNVTFYAKYTPKTYTVTFDSKGGSSVRSQEVNHGAKATTPTEPTREGYEFQGWYTSEDATASVYDFDTAVTQDIMLYAKWTPKQYKVSYSFISGTTGEELPTEVTNQLPAETQKLNGSEVIAPPSFTSVEVKGANDVVIGTWSFDSWNPEKQTVNGQDISFEGTWIYTVAPALGEWKYTVNQHFINAKGEKTDRGTSVTVADTTVKTLQESIPDGMQQNQNFGDPAQNYVYIAKETTYQVNSEKKNASDSLDNGAVIDLYYYLDVIGEEKPDAPDGTPDCYQVTINYVTDNTGRGKITSLTKEVKTIKDATGNPINKGTVMATGSTAEATGSRNYFSNWANDAGLPTSSTAKLGKQTFNAEGGETYTFTANFGYSGGGGGGGSRPTVTIPDDVPTGLNGKDHYAYIIGYGNNDVRPQNNITRARWLPSSSVC